MPYATIADVENLNSARTFTEVSKPTVDEVAGYLTDTAAEIDAALRGQRYALPIPTTATDALDFLKAGNAQGGYAYSERAAEASPHRKDAWKAWTDWLKRLQKGESVLDAPKDIDTTYPRGQFPTCPMFTRAQRF